MSAKKIHGSSIIGQQGVNLIERVVLGMGFAWYPSGGVEAGIDGTMEIRDAVTGEATTFIIRVQSKATTACPTAPAMGLRVLRRPRSEQPRV